MSEQAQLSLLELFDQPIAKINLSEKLYIDLLCLRCDEVFPGVEKQKGKRPKLCAPCRRLHKNERNRRNPCYQRAKDADKQKNAERIAARAPIFCKTCDVRLEHPRRKFCSKKCTDKYHADIETQQIKDRFGGEYPTLKCHECETDFVAVPLGPRPRKFCSQVCSKKSISRLRCKARRAATKTEIWDYVDPLIIFRRDNWTCQMCGCETPAYKRGSYDDDAPSLDHIIPISRGGPHTEENCRCLCRLCNGKKGALLDEELAA